MSTVEKSTDVDVPITVAYGQWIQFEEFPSFMEGVESIQQLEDSPPLGRFHRWHSAGVGCRNHRAASR